MPKQEFMKYVKKRVELKVNSQRKLDLALDDIKFNAIERCSKRRWRRGQP